MAFVPSALLAPRGPEDHPERSAFASPQEKLEARPGDALARAAAGLLPSREDLLAPFQRVPEAERRRLLVARIEQLKRQAQAGSLRAHTQLVHRTDSGEPQVAYRHHDEWVRVMEDRENFPYVVVSAPPGYAKSSWFTIAYPTQRIGITGGRVRIGLIANTHAIARGFSQAIRDAVESPWFQLAYPSVRPDTDRAWRDNEWSVTGLPPGPNYSLAAMGMNGPVQSRRFDEIILDDPTTYQQARSKEELEKQRKWLKNTLLKRFPPGMRPPDGKGRMIVVLTRWATNDLVPTLQELGFKHVNMPALGYWDRTVLCPECGNERNPDIAAVLQRCEHCDTTERPEIQYGDTALWGALETAEVLQREREDDELMFELVMQGNPQVLSGEMFDPAWFQRGVPPALEEYDQNILSCDTASGKKKGAGDYFVLARLGILSNDVWIDSIDRGRYNALEREDHVLAALGLKAVGRDGWEVVDERLWRNKPVALVIEDKNEGTDLIQRMRARHVPVRIIPAQAVNEKAYRASPLAGAYRNGNVKHPGYPQEDGSWKVPKWVRSYEAELEAFPDGPHDDMVDAVAHGYNHIGQRGPKVTAA